MIKYAAENPVWFFTVLAVYIIGIGSAALAILRSRTPQGATAWVMSLISFPFFSVPLFMIFGRSKFEGYNNKRRVLDDKVRNKFDALNTMSSDVLPAVDEMELLSATIPNKNQPGFTIKNSIELLVNGDETFNQIIEELENASNYIVFQFFIFRIDKIGNQLLEILMRKARSGVRVSFLNDDIGSTLPKKIRKKMEEAGIKVGTFNKRNGRGRLQVNFRNHRKVVIVDGKVAFVGGHNVGDEYLGRDPVFGFWRDTHVKLKGPSVIAAQLATAKDWFCVHEKDLDVDWKIHPAEENAHVMVLHSGPADDRHSCLLSHIALINSSQKRVWIANPYIVPPESLLDALLLASLRGVDVRIILPSYSDAKTVLLASKVYQEICLRHGIKLYKYTKGFLHQKVMLIDDQFATIGSANFDCRSMFINFEITAITSDKKVISDMDSMLTRDFKDSILMPKDSFEHQTTWSKILSRGANLWAPVL